VLAARKTAAPPEHSQAILDAFITASEDVGVDLDPRVMNGRQCLVCGDIINSGAYRSGASILSSIRRSRMSRQLQAALAVILLPIAFFLLWYFPGYEGAIGCMVVILLSILFYILSEKQPAA
jgi:hypothetical protein